MPSNIKICILSELAYSLLKGKGIRGGSELQMKILAEELVKRSYDVSFITFEKSGFSYEVIDGIKVYNLFNTRNRGSTYLYPPKLCKLLKTLKKINADIYIQRAATPLTGLIGFFTKLNNKIFLFSASSNNDVNIYLSLKSVKYLKNLFFWYGVKHCDLVLCQTNYQKNLLKKTLGKAGEVIKNLYPLSINLESHNISSDLKILWVGRIRKDKRPELFLKIAELFPQYNFWMIGGPSSAHPNYYHEIKESAMTIKNLEFIGFVPYCEMNNYYKKSNLLVNTSPSEGFPNTFLEAWGNHIPVISLGFDPDEIICRYELGFHSNNFNDLIKKIHILLTNESLRLKMGIKGRKYVEKEHNTNTIIDIYEKLFKTFKIMKNI